MTQPIDMDTLRSEYDQYCRVLGEKNYILWATRQEIRSLRAAIRGLNQKAAELGAKDKPEEASDVK